MGIVRLFQEVNALNRKMFLKSNQLKKQKPFLQLQLSIPTYNTAKFLVPILRLSAKIKYIMKNLLQFTKKICKQDLIHLDFWTVQLWIQFSSTFFLMKLLMFASIICMENAATLELKQLLCLALKVFLIIYNGFFQNEIDSVVTVSPLGRILYKHFQLLSSNQVIPQDFLKFVLYEHVFFLWKQEKKTKYLFLLASFLLKCKQGKFSVVFCFNSFQWYIY